MLMVIPSCHHTGGIMGANVSKCFENKKSVVVQILFTWSKTKMSRFNISWKSHYGILLGRLSSLYYLFRNLKQVLMERQLLYLYHAQGTSIIRHSLFLWGNSASVDDVRILRIMGAICLCGDWNWTSRLFILCTYMTYVAT